MGRDVERYCRDCNKCQQSKLSMPQRAPLTSMPIGRPWQMIAVDILQVPHSRNNNRYLLVVQDYFTKWVEAIPLLDQTAIRITGELTKLHSDQGRNFESDILSQTLQAFGVQKSRTTAYHPQGDGMVERFNRSLLQLLRTYVETQDDWERYLIHYPVIKSMLSCTTFLSRVQFPPPCIPLVESANTQAFSPHLCGFLGRYCMKERRPLYEIFDSSMAMCW